MKVLSIFITFFSIYSLISQLYADGTYYIGKDAGGVYFQTDQDGDWYIDGQDMENFKFGETGTYYI
jgi:hypothetical protein